MINLSLFPPKLSVEWVVITNFKMSMNHLQQKSERTGKTWTKQIIISQFEHFSKPIFKFFILNLMCIQNNIFDI